MTTDGIKAWIYIALGALIVAACAYVYFGFIRQTCYPSVVGSTYDPLTNTQTTQYTGAMVCYRGSAE